MGKGAGAGAGAVALLSTKLTQLTTSLEANFNGTNWAKLVVLPQYHEGHTHTVPFLIIFSLSLR